jgi:hypothetical protein
VGTGTKRKEIEETQPGSKKGIYPSEKRSKHHPALVSPAQDLLVKKSSKNRVV